MIYSMLLEKKDLKNEIDKFKVKERLSKYLSPGEIKALENCEARGGSFDSCFNENHKGFGLRTFLCIKNEEYCPRFTNYEFNKMRTQ